MQKRIIAGLMLVSLLCGSGTVTFASLASAPAMMQHARNSDEHSRSRHACCPSSRSLAPTLFITSNIPAMPCSEHPCCARRAPQGPASLPAVSGAKSPEVSAAIVTRQLTLVSTRQASPAVQAETFLRPYSSLSTVLRI